MHKNNKTRVRTPRADRGFTLIELMVALAVVAVVVTFAGPSFADFIDRQRQVTGANQLVLALSLARSESVKRNQSVTFCKSVDGQSCAGASTGWEAGWIVFANTAAANAATRESDEPVLRIFAGLPARTLNSPDLGAEFVAFRPDGTANVRGSFVLCDRGGAQDALAVLLDANGRAAVSRTIASGAKPTCPGEDEL